MICKFSESLYSSNTSIHFIGNGGHEENKMNSDGRPTTNNAPMKTKKAILVVPALVLLAIYNIIVGVGFRLARLDNRRRARA